MRRLISFNSGALFGIIYDPPGLVMIKPDRVALVIEATDGQQGLSDFGGLEARRTDQAVLQHPLRSKLPQIRDLGTMAWADICLTRLGTN